MRIEYDRQARAMYWYVAEGIHVQTIEIETLEIYIDIDAEGVILGVEFLSMEALQRYLDKYGSMNVPTYYVDSGSLV